MSKKRTEEYIITKINLAISELVNPRYQFQKYYNYYNGRRDPELFRYLEENYGIGLPTSVEFTPLIRKHIDALIGEYLDVPLLPKVSCKDKETISKMDREKLLLINNQVYQFLKLNLNNKLILFIDGKNIVDMLILTSIDKLIDDVNEDFVSEYEKAALYVIEYLILSRNTDFRNKLKESLLDLLVCGCVFYRAHPSPSNSNVELETFSPINTFPERNPNSVYVKDCKRIVIRRWYTIDEILVKYGDLLSQEAKEELESKRQPTIENSYMYVRAFENVPVGGPATDGLQAGVEVIPGFPYELDFSYNYRLFPVYEVEWIDEDEEDGKYIQNRYEGVKICDSIYIPTGKSKNVIRSKDDPLYCGLSVNGIFFTNRVGKPYSLVGACMHLQDKYDIINFFKDNVIANSGTAGDWLDLAVLPTALGSDLIERIQKYQAYKKSGIGFIDSSQDGRGLSSNTIYSGYDDTLKLATMQAFDLALQRIEDTCSSITGVFRERLNGILQKDAVTNVQVGIKNSYTVTKQYHLQMDTLAIDMLLDCLNVSKIVWKNGLTGTIILGDKYSKIFTSLPKYFTLTDYDIHIIPTSEIMKEMSIVLSTMGEFIKTGLLDADIIIDAMTSKSLTDLKSKISKAFKKRKAENDLLMLLTQLLEQANKLIKELTEYNKQLERDIKQLDAARIENEKSKIMLDNELGWYKALTDRKSSESKSKNDTKRTEIEYAQLFDTNPYNDKIKRV